MEKERGAKVIALIALVVGVIGLSVGFAGWTAQLTISGTQAEISAGSGSAGAELFGDLIEVSDVSCADKSATATVQSVGTATAHSWSGTKVTLTKQGDYVECTAKVTNGSNYTAYLDDIKILNSIQCSGTGQNVQNACDALKLTVTGTGSGTGAKDSIATVQASSISNALSISGNPIEPTKEGTIKLKIEYFGSAISDTDFIATIPSVTFDYSTVD